MATSFLDKTGLGTLWSKIKSTFALKSEIPDSTSDLTNDSGFIDSATFDITLTSHWDSATDTTTFTADKTYSEISAALDSGKILYANYSGILYKYDGIYENEIQFCWEGITLLNGQGNTTNTFINYNVFVVDSTNTWTFYDSGYTLASRTSQLTNDSGFITDAGVTSFNGATGAVTYSAVTYTLSISNNVITLTGSDGSTSSVTLPVYAGGVSS